MLKEYEMDYIIHRAGLPQHNIVVRTKAKPNTDGVIVLSRNDYEASILVETPGSGKEWDVTTLPDRAVIHPRAMRFDDPIVQKYLYARLMPSGKKKEYDLVTMVESTGDWNYIAHFEAIDDDAANKWAEKHYPKLEWYVLDDKGENING